MTSNMPSGEELRSAAAHGVRWSAVARPVTEVLQLASMVALARLVVPSEFGRFAIAVIAQEVAYLIVAGGLGNALVQRKTVTREHLQTGMALGLLSGIGLALLTLLGASLLITPVFGARTADFARLMAPLCLVSGLSTVPMAVLRRRMAFRRLSEIEVLSSVVRVVVCVALALAGLEGEALVLGVLAGSISTALVAWLSAPPPLPRLLREPARELLQFALPMSLASVTWVGFSNVDYAIIGARLGALQTGFYFRAYTLAVEYQSKIGVVMQQVGFPVLSRTTSAAQLSQIYRQMVRLLTVVLFPLLVGLAITAPKLVPLVFGARWSAAVVPVQILALGGASTLVINAAGAVLMAQGRARAMLGYGTAHFAVYGLTVLAVVRLGITAVAIDAAVVHTIFLGVAYALMLRGERRPLLRLWQDVAPATISCLGLAAAAVPGAMLLSRAHVASVPWLLTVSLLGATAYLVTLRGCYPEVWHSQLTLLRRVLPSRSAKPQRDAAAARPVPADAGSPV